MIKINLNYNESAKKSSLAGSLGSSVKDSGLNISLLALCALIGFGPQFILEDIWGKKITKKEEEVSSLRLAGGKLKGSIRGIEKERAKLEDLEKKEKEFSEKSKIVSEVFDRKNNPMKLMKYISENIPRDVWILEISLKNEKLKINGYALSFLSINKFLKNLNESVFLNKKAKLDNYVTKTLKPSKRRVEEFNISSKVVKF